MIVGIDNTSDRIDEYAPVTDFIYGQTMGGRGDDYADFVEETVREKVRDLYGEPWPSGVMGSSLGGLISLRIADDTDASDNYCENVQLRDALVGAGYRLDQDLFYFWDADAPHNNECQAPSTDRRREAADLPGRPPKLPFYAGPRPGGRVGGRCRR